MRYQADQYCHGAQTGHHCHGPEDPQPKVAPGAGSPGMPSLKLSLT